jgi:hypothetical protein
MSLDTQLRKQRCIIINLHDATEKEIEDLKNILQEDRWDWHEDKINY